MHRVACVLVVDDSALSRRKMAMAVKNLGHRSIEADSGEAALATLRAQDVDLILLDILMPGIDGFDVLAALRADARLASIPVLVISGMEGDMQSVARAIELGATDFLPKDFDPILFRARVTASIERKLLRDLEVEYLRQVERLSAAAAEVEDGTFDPDELDLGDIAQRRDGLGKLATVFVSMAKVVHERERKLRKVITKLDHSYHLSGLALVMIAAALWATVGVASQLYPQEGDLPEEVFGFARTVVAGPALLLAALIAGGRAGFCGFRQSAGGFLSFGLCCAIFQIGLFRSFSLLGVTITVFLTVCLPPILAVAWSMWRRTEHVSKHIHSAIGMAIVGLIAFSSTAAENGEMHKILLGLAFSIAASVAFVIMSHAARGLAASHSPLLIAGLGLTFAAVFLGPAAYLMVPVSMSELATRLMNWERGSVLIYLGLVPTALAYVCYCSGMARCRSAVAGLVASMIEPAVATGLAFLFLGEILSPWEIMGCVLLFFAMLTLWLDEAPQDDDAQVPNKNEPGAA